MSCAEPQKSQRCACRGEVRGGWEVPLAGGGGGGGLGLLGGEPHPAIPGADSIARLVLRHLERQQAFGPERVLGLLVGDELRRATEVATLRLPLRIEHRNRLTALALDVTLFGLPATLVIGDPAQRSDQIVLDDPDGAGVELRRRSRAAERADQRLLGRIPDRLRSARRTGEFLSG